MMLLLLFLLYRFSDGFIVQPHLGLHAISLWLHIFVAAQLLWPTGGSGSCFVQERAECMTRYRLA